MWHLNVLKVAPFPLKYGACGDNEPTSDTNHEAHLNADQALVLIQVKNGLICERPYLLHLWPELTPQTHLQKHPLICPLHHRDTERVRHSYSSVDIYWLIEGLQFTFNTERLLVWADVSWYQLLPFNVAIPTCLANGEHPTHEPHSLCIL